MSANDDPKVFYGVTMKPKPRPEEERVAVIRQNEKRKRKETLYSYRSGSH